MGMEGGTARLRFVMQLNRSWTRIPLLFLFLSGFSLSEDFSNNLIIGPIKGRIHQEGKKL